MQLLEMMTLEDSDSQAYSECLESATLLDMVLEGREIPNDYVREVKKIAYMFSKTIGEKARTNRSLIKFYKKIQKKPVRHYGFGDNNMGDVPAISLQGKMKPLGYKCSINVDNNNGVETRYYLKDVPGGYVNVIVSTNVPNNKWGKNSSYIIAKYVESDKVTEDLLKLFK